MPLLSRQKLVLHLTKTLDIKIKSIDQDAVDLVNGIVEKIIMALFPKDASVLKSQVLQRLALLSTSNDFINQVVDALNSQPLTAVSPQTLKREIRSHAGDVKVPEDTLSYVSLLIQQAAVNVLTDALDVMGDNEHTIEGRHVVKYLFETPEGLESGVHLSPIGPLEKKDKKSRSKKRCSPRQISVKSFVRDGQRIKSYCRKKSSKK